ncbi:MAG: hypothetical protein GY696_34275, partial [Gammaproteobacteria bacterium]|nr:hypothetical protein [Gammaproteobacteria bacterium]
MSFLFIATLDKLQQHFQSSSAAQNAANKAKQNAVAMMRNSTLTKVQTKSPLTGTFPAASGESPADSSPSSDRFSNGVNFEDADRVVTDLVKTSLYGDEGRQRLYEAILMVLLHAIIDTEYI